MIWNPTEGIDLGFFMIRFYSLTWVAAFAFGWYIMKYIFVRENESIEKLDKLFVYTIVATMLGARLGHVIFYQSELFTEDPLSILLPISTIPEIHFTGFSGLASHGAAIAIIVTMYYIQSRVLQRPLLWILDRIVVPVSFGAIFIRLGNFMNSEIFGKTTTKDSFLAMKFIKGEDSLSPKIVTKITNIPDASQAYNAIEKDSQFKFILDQVPYRYPAQLYEALLYIPVFLLLFFLYWKTDARNKSGFLFGLFLVLLWSIRFGVEFVKDSQGGFEKYPIFNALSTGQWLSIPFIILGFYFIYQSTQNSSK
ncbi:prolipoprotein diacylglyceryl transferase [Flavobacterium sp. 20NA77.7]|uniref:Phosphatidylglycerol--prolipoprotein diacylglyceryl transferase n=1 Tax=Flavobacterium nakdongensis TaxID=3073563 RepID=A0ABY9RA95_9FLAO|nr:prolipoprotein diacylglyceryl transferase [Flavobacterium sp. 20NA77.7]WMW77260.1 prolipoprotein diacylglyceryl transferase [Flavobacterium sp. 20NA77.7]